MTKPPAKTPKVAPPAALAGEVTNAPDRMLPAKEDVQLARLVALLKERYPTLTGVDPVNVCYLLRDALYREWCIKETANDKAVLLLAAWLNRQGHDRCWYYPELFTQLCELFGVRQRRPSALPPRAEFERGCARYQKEQYDV